MNAYETIEHEILYLLHQAEDDAIEAARVEEANGYSDALESMARTELEGMVTGLSAALTIVRKNSKGEN